MVYVGIDWAEKCPNEFSILTEDGTLVKRGSIPRSVDGARELIEQLARLRSDPAEVLIGIDRKNDVLTSVLHSEGYEVYPLNPLSTDRARQIYYPAGQKDDGADSLVHAQMVRTDRRRLRPLGDRDQKDARLRRLLKTRAQLVDTRAQYLQRLGSVLAESSPILSGLCEDLRRQWVVDLLRRWPLEQDFCGVHGNSLNAFLDRHRVSEETERKIRSARRQTPYRHPEQMAECYRGEIEAMLDLIASVQEQIDRLEAKIEKLRAEHPDNEIFSSLPTGGAITLAALCTAFGPDRQIAYGWRDFSSYFGTSPITRQSGATRQVRMRRARDPVMHRALLQLADATRRKADCWAHGYYLRKRQEGKGHYHALRCLACRWVKILYAMWRNRTPYDEEFHLRRRRERGGIVASRGGAGSPEGHLSAERSRK